MISYYDVSGSMPPSKACICDSNTPFGCLPATVSELVEAIDAAHNKLSAMNQLAF